MNQKRQSARTAIITPRLLSKAQAAIYCGVSVNSFAAICSVRPIALGAGTSLLRYDTAQLDEWIDGLTLGHQPSHAELLALITGDTKRSKRRKPAKT